MASLEPVAGQPDAGSAPVGLAKAKATIGDLTGIADRARHELAKVVIGQDQVLEQLMISLLANGHVLLEGPPGTGKTLIVRTLAATLDLAFGRIQFTPDLMPGDVLGTNLFDFKSGEFTLTRGPIFTQFLLADEINRAPPKTQAALLQAMNERVVTIDGHDYPLGDGFMVVATQNPIEQQGTYPLPEAQLDRFLFKLLVEFPERAEEIEVVQRHGNRALSPRIEDFPIERIADLARLNMLRDTAAAITMTDELIAYTVDLVRDTRDHPMTSVGASTRAAAMIATAARARAALHLRDYVIPDDVKALIAPALRHRILPSPGAEIEGITPDRILSEIVEKRAAPR